jgi:iron(II)-dependent oxidoreductase
MKNICVFFIAAIVLMLPGRLIAQEREDRTVTIAAGEFVMGSNYCAERHGNSDWCGDEIPRKVTLAAFSIDKYEVTNDEYAECVNRMICGPNGIADARPQEFIQPNQPVVFVTWSDAETYCSWRGGRLPTEAEWEKSAQAEKLGGAVYGLPYGQGSPQHVGSLDPNSNGLYDMMGNVYEWTADWYGPYPVGEAQVDPTGPATGKEKVVRGGGWNSPAHYLRASDRVARTPDLRYSDVGFRCVRSSQKKGN